jgi:hypothetical protein
MLERFAKDGESGPISGGHQAIVHPLSLASRRHNSGPAEVREMSGDLWLANAEYFNEVADADLFVRDKVQQAQPGGVRQRAKQEIKREVGLSLRHGDII